MPAAASRPADDAPALPESLRGLAARGERRRYRKGMLLIQEGDRSDTLFIVLSGRVKAFSSDERDREITYGIYGAGEYLGEMSLDGGPRSASVITLEATECAVITRQTLREHIAANPEFAFELLNRVIGRARMATESARNLALLDAYGRLVKALNDLAGDSKIIEARPTHQELASRIGSSREMVSRLMKDLERGGYIAVDGRKLQMLRALPLNW
jgi:CRP/FNR family cyclic AMP-dependent transcriptional regulator